MPCGLKRTFEKYHHLHGSKDFERGEKWIGVVAPKKKKQPKLIAHKNIS